MQTVATHPGFSLATEPLLDGDAGTHQTIQRIRSLVDAGIKDPLVNKTAGTILRLARVAPYDDLGEIRAVFSWVLGNIRFTKDPDGKETLRPAATVLEWGFGDCDDINAILLPSLLGTIGYRTRVVTIASDPRDPDSFTHVYCEALYRGRWIPLDAARKNTRFGSEPARQFRKRVWSLVADEHEDLKGLGDCRAGGCHGTLGSAHFSPRFTRPHYNALGSQMRLGRTYPSSGLGRNYFYPAHNNHARLGQIDLSDIANAIAASTAGAANIIRAQSGQPQLVFPSASAYPAPGATAYGVPAPVGPTASGSFTITPGLAILGGLVLLAMIARK